MLPLGEADAALNPQLDKHFSSISELLQSRETYAGETRSLVNGLMQVVEYCVGGCVYRLGEWGLRFCRIPCETNKLSALYNQQ